MSISDWVFDLLHETLEIGGGVVIDGITFFPLVTILSLLINKGGMEGKGSGSSLSRSQARSARSQLSRDTRFEVRRIRGRTHIAVHSPKIDIVYRLGDAMEDD